MVSLTSCRASIASSAQFRTVLLQAAVATATGEAETSRDESGPHTLSSQRPQTPQGAQLGCKNGCWP
jgi:hypothetical protein